MKKSIFFAAAVLLAVGCQKSELLDNTQEQKMITHTFSVDDEATKSLFDPSDGYVKLDKTESIAVGCAPITPTGAPINEIVEAKRSGDTYSFTHTADATATGYNYFFVMPYRGTSNINTNGSKAAMYVKIDGVQHPTATSFDPLQDYIIGEPILNATEQQTELSSSKLRLKRLFAPLRITLRDGADEFKGDPLMSVSIGFPITTESDKKNNLATLVYLKSTKTEDGKTVVADFSEAGPSGYAGVDTPHVSPTVTAEYSDGLAMDNGTYTVWYVTLPVEKAAGTVLTVTAQSKNRKVTREIKLPSDIKLKAGVINDLKINITGDGYVAEDTADPNDYWSIYNAGQDIVAGGLTINKSSSSYPNATLLSGETLTQANLQKGGLIFVEGDFTATGHLKLAKGSIIIGRYKDSQPSITMNGSYAIYLDNGDIILKNLNIGGSTSAGRLIVISSNASAVSSDYAVIEDCNITAPKNVCGYAAGTPTYIIKKLTFDNCIIKMEGTDANYSVLNINALTAIKDETQTVIGYVDSSVYKDIEKFEISNCVIYAEKPYLKATPERRLLMDLGSGVAGGNYAFPLDNAAIVVNNNTLYNINTNGNVIARAFYCKSAEINSNVVYNDYACLAPLTNFTANYMFGLYSGINNSNNGAYNIKKNYSYGYYDSTQESYVTTTLKGSTISWGYTKKEFSPSYTTSSNNQANGTVKDDPFTKVDMTKGYFPVNTANIQKATGASYDTKPWVKVK